MKPDEAQRLVEWLAETLPEKFYAVANGDLVEIHLKEEEPKEQVKFHF